jgi:hypothetical protein
MPDDNKDHTFIVKMALRNALKLIPGLSKKNRDKDEDIVVLKLLRELDVMGYEIVKKPGNAGFTFDTLGGDGAV